MSKFENLSTNLLSRHRISDRIFNHRLLQKHITPGCMKQNPFKAIVFSLVIRPLTNPRLTCRWISHHFLNNINFITNTRKMRNRRYELIVGKWNLEAREPYLLRWQWTVNESFTKVMWFKFFLLSCSSTWGRWKELTSLKWDNSNRITSLLRPFSGTKKGFYAT